MKKTLTAMAIVAVAFSIMSCNKQPKQNDTKESPVPAEATPAKGEQQIAYVEIDSIMSQYKHSKDFRRQTTANSTSCCKLPTEYSSQQIHSTTG